MEKVKLYLKHAIDCHKVGSVVEVDKSEVRLWCGKGAVIFDEKEHSAKKEEKKSPKKKKKGEKKDSSKEEDKEVESKEEEK